MDQNRQMKSKSGCNCEFCFRLIDHGSCVCEYCKYKDNCEDYRKCSAERGVDE